MIPDFDLRTVVPLVALFLQERREGFSTGVTFPCGIVFAGEEQYGGDVPSHAELLVDGTTRPRGTFDGQLSAAIEAAQTQQALPLVTTLPSNCEWYFSYTCIILLHSEVLGLTVLRQRTAQRVPL